MLEDPETGALALVGGKLTTYRQMAQDAVDRLTDRRCRTRAAPARRRRRGAPAGSLPRLARRYGAETPEVAALGLRRDPVAPGVPVCEAELRWAVENELALTSTTSPTAAPAPGSCPSGARRSRPPPLG